MIKPDTHFTIGADPEMFIINEKTRAVVSAIGLIPGEKGNPWRDPSWGPGFGIEIDNILVEYNIPPVDTKEDFIEVVNFMKDYIDRYLKRINPELGILCASSMMVDKDQLDNPIAQLFGCCPDFNCYTGAPNPRPRGEKTNLRSAGFHVHYGYEHPSIDQSVEMVKYFDIFLGLMSLLFDTDRKRRSLYGKAGCYRLTSYGVEYRTLSSRMGDDDTTLGLIYDGVVARVNMEYICGVNPVKPGIDLLDEKTRSIVIISHETLARGQVLRGLDDPKAIECYNKAWDKIKAVDAK